MSIDYTPLPIVVRLDETLLLWFLSTYSLITSPSNSTTKSSLLIKERIYYEDKIAETKQAIHDRLMTLNEEYISKIKDVQQAEIDGVKELQKAYQDAEDARTKEITSAISIFDEFERKTDVFGSKLIENLRGQVDAMRDWATDLQMLASKGIDKGLLAELQALGPNAQAEISALNKLSTIQIVKCWY
ncbi:hypothetical protein [Lysinibacillus capsici]|uniref:hypothetical protein n=1 Tax=Lysinibacillus capsici TaxID=2115968 RepID=UPI00325FA07C